MEPLGIRVSIVEPGPFRTNFAGKGLVLAGRIIDDYAETAGAFKAKLQNVDGKQEGDPYKAAKAIFEMVNEPQVNLRLPLGKIPLTTIRTKIDSLRSDLEENRNIAENAVFD